MFFYFVIFFIIGFGIGSILKNFKIAMVLIVAITFCWVLIFGPWALATFFELILGYAMANGVKSLEKSFEGTPSSGRKEFPGPTSGVKIYTNSIGMNFVLIPAGTFQRDAGNEENPIPNGLKVTVSKPFYLGIYAVTQEQWEAVMGHTPVGVNGRRHWQYKHLTSLATAEDGWAAWKKAVGWANPSWFLGRDNPVDSVSWEDAQEFINRLNAMENHQRYRLPTNMERELAAKGGTHTKFFLGEDESLMGDYAWIPDNADNMTHPVGQKKPNPYGLYDIYGNVSEWVQDWRSDFPKGEVRDYSGPSSGEYRVSRGGRTLSAAEFYVINDFDPEFWHYLQGFRVAFSSKDVPETLGASASCLDTVQVVSWTLNDLPEALREPKFYLNAVRTNGRALASVPKTLRTPKLCLAAVQSNGRALEYVPEKLKTPELCLEAVQSNGSALQYVPEDLKFLFAADPSCPMGMDDFMPDADLEDDNCEDDECPFERDEGGRWCEISDDRIPNQEIKSMMKSQNMPLKFTGSIELLKKIVEEAGFIGKWELKHIKSIQCKYIFRCENRGVLNWWKHTGTVLFQGKDKARQELSNIVEKYLMEEISLQESENGKTSDNTSKL